MGVQSNLNDEVPQQQESVNGPASKKTPLGRAAAASGAPHSKPLLLLRSSAHALSSASADAARLARRRGRKTSSRAVQAQAPRNCCDQQGALPRLTELKPRRWTPPLGNRTAASAQSGANTMHLNSSDARSPRGRSLPRPASSSRECDPPRRAHAHTMRHLATLIPFAPATAPSLLQAVIGEA